MTLMALSPTTISVMFAKHFAKHAVRNLVSLNIRHTARADALVRLNMQPQAVYSTTTLQDAGAPTFKSMQGKLDTCILKALESMQYEYMTPVQSKVLTTLPSLRSDCLVQAKTGTGKTIAFLIPALQSLLTSRPVQREQVAVLILSPTRELALQIAKECDQLTSHLPNRIACHTAYGGTARASNMKKFLQGSPTVLVATPGRLKDYLTEKQAVGRFADIRTLILDEADTMLAQGFLLDVKHILRLLPPKSNGWQGMCFSATVPDKIRDVINVILEPGYSKISTIDRSEPPTHARVPQYHVIIPSIKDTFAALLSLVNYEYQRSPIDSKIIVFGTTANLAALYAAFFRAPTGLPLEVFELHSRLGQGQRTRTTEAFKKASSGLMLATDVIGRGMDFPNVTCVIQVGLPTDGEQYVHRVGRTARADKDGRAVILLTQAETFFLNTNRQLPIEPYEHTVAIKEDKKAAATAAQIMATNIDAKAKQKAYSAYLGFMKASINKMKLTSAALVTMANQLAVLGMGCPEPPELDKLTVGKMGLKGVPGIRYASRAAPAHDNPQSDGLPLKRPAPPARPEALAKRAAMDPNGRHPPRDSFGAAADGGGGAAKSAARARGRRTRAGLRDREDWAARLDREGEAKWGRMV
ncbi:MAG: ATP-dependent RNA helicase mss116 [Lasallia pustulata]|uniref:ATP-dependent RNA helicase n=1 Tax=Lasallia pustulata TaxID=136370 RepID=A0A5M8Q1N6_9LECA|nr:MAG: ATP-dependent RNA helicase mss116 [Lasallia pustulata]